MNATREDCGLASVGIPMMAGLLNRTFSSNGLTLKITAADLVEANTISDMVEVVEAAKTFAEGQGIRSLNVVFGIPIS